MRKEVLRMENVTFQEQGLTLLEDFSLRISSGEIMGLLAVDSHGLTPLTKVLQENLPIQRGFIYYRERQINNWRTPRPGSNRIGVIRSESCLVDGLTVADNIFVLRPGFRTWIIRKKVLYQQLQPLLDELNVNIAADAYVEQLSSFQRFVVELIKAVVAGCWLILLRDVGSFISDLELSRLHSILRHYAAQGISFLYIGYHMEELSQICDRTAVLINGRITKILQTGELPEYIAESYERLVRKQIGHRIPEGPDRISALEAIDLWGGAVQGLSFRVAPGECLVLQDLENRIFEDLLALVLGDLKPAHGAFRLDGAPFVPEVNRKLAVIRENPASTMLFPKMNYLENLCFTMDHRMPELWWDRKTRTGMKQAYVQRFGENLFEHKVEQLTKTQKYDLVYRRILLQNPRVAFCIQPFKGADKELRMHIWDLMRGLLEHGIAVVILAVNLADSLSLADRLVRIRPDGADEVYERKDFAELPFDAPFLYLYQEAKMSGD